MHNSKNLSESKPSLGGTIMKYFFIKKTKALYTYWAKPLFSNTSKCISDLDYFLITNKHI